MNETPYARDFGLVDNFRVGAVGTPGQRVFYLLIEVGNDQVWFKCEKEQAHALAQQSLEAMLHLDRVVDEEIVGKTVREAGEMPEPGLSHEFIIESMAMRINSDHFFQIMLKGSEEEQAMFMITPEQLRAMAILALESVNAGRPQCPLCLLPEDPEGHDCPSSNGHKASH